MPIEVQFGGPEANSEEAAQFAFRDIEARRQAQRQLQANLYEQMFRTQQQDYLLNRHQDFQQNMLGQRHQFMQDQQGRLFDQQSNLVQQHSDLAGQRQQGRLSRQDQLRKQNIDAYRSQLGIEESRIRQQDPQLQTPANQRRMNDINNLHQRLDAQEAGIKPLAPEPLPIDQAMNDSVAFTDEQGNRLPSGQLPPGAILTRNSKGDVTVNEQPHLQAQREAAMKEQQMAHAQTAHEQAIVHTQQVHEQQMQHDIRAADIKHYNDARTNALNARIKAMTPKLGPLGPDGKATQITPSQEEVEAQVKPWDDLAESLKPSWMNPQQPQATAPVQQPVQPPPQSGGAMQLPPMNTTPGGMAAPPPMAGHGQMAPAATQPPPAASGANQNVPGLGGAPAYPKTAEERLQVPQGVPVQKPDGTVGPNTWPTDEQHHDTIAKSPHLPQVNTPQDKAQLPKGVYYRAPDGSVRYNS